MLTPDKLHGYQQKAVNFQCTHQQSALWLDMGLGKTAITLTSIEYLQIGSRYYDASAALAALSETQDRALASVSIELVGAALLSGTHAL